MALITCPECGHDMSDKAVSCPHCGYVLQPNDIAATSQKNAAPGPAQEPAQPTPAQPTTVQPQPVANPGAPKPPSHEGEVPPAAPPIDSVPSPSRGKKKGHKALKIVLIVLALLLLVGMCSSGGEDKGSSASSDGSDASAEPASDSGQSSDAASQDSSEPYETNVVRFDYYTNSIGSFEYHGIVEVKNTSDHDLYLDTASSSFDIEDASGHLITTEKFISACPDVISPGETGYFYNGLGGDSTDMSVDASQALNLVANVSVEDSRVANVRYPVTDTALTTSSDGVMHVTGRVENDTNEDDSLMYVQVELFDADGNILAVTGTTLTDLTAGSQQGFDISCLFISDAVKADQVASYQVIANKQVYQF